GTSPNGDAPRRSGAPAARVFTDMFPSFWAILRELFEPAGRPDAAAYPTSLGSQRGIRCRRSDLCVTVRKDGLEVLEMLGFHISVYRLADGGTLPATASSRPAAQIA